MSPDTACSGNSDPEVSPSRGDTIDVATVLSCAIYGPPRTARASRNAKLMSAVWESDPGYGIDQIAKRVTDQRQLTGRLDGWYEFSRRLQLRRDAGQLVLTDARIKVCFIRASVLFLRDVAR